MKCCLARLVNVNDNFMLFIDQEDVDGKTSNIVYKPLFTLDLCTYHTKHLLCDPQMYVCVQASF